jgi:hypothetical protein
MLISPFQEHYQHHAQVQHHPAVKGEGVVDYARYLIDLTVHMLLRHQAYLTQGQVPARPWELQARIGELLRRTRISYSIVLLGLMYLVRYHSACMIKTTSLSLRGVGEAYLVMCTCLLLANKFLLDRPINNRQWAELAGVDPAALSRHEVLLLRAVHYELHVDARDFGHWVRHVFAPERTAPWRRQSLPPTPLSIDEDSTDANDGARETGHRGKRRRHSPMQWH